MEGSRVGEGDCKGYLGLKHGALSVGKEEYWGQKEDLERGALDRICKKSRRWLEA